jgi:hypothetical protein
MILCKPNKSTHTQTQTTPPQPCSCLFLFFREMFSKPRKEFGSAKGRKSVSFIFSFVLHKEDKTRKTISLSLSLLRADLRRRDDERQAHAQQHHDQARPRDEAARAQAVGVAALAPQVGRVDGRVAVDVGAVLVGELWCFFVGVGCFGFDGFGEFLFGGRAVSSRRQSEKER